MAVVTLGDLNDPNSRKRSARGEPGGGPHKNVKAKRVDYEVDEVQYRPALRMYILARLTDVSNVPGRRL